jgi:hypothetical protein
MMDQSPISPVYGRVADHPGAIRPTHFQCASYLRFPLFTSGNFAPQLVEEVEQKRQVRERLIGVRIISEQGREAIAVRRQPDRSWKGRQDLAGESRSKPEAFPP